MAATDDSKKLFWGMAQRRDRLGPTRRGWLLMLALASASALLVIHGVHGFLAVNEPITGGSLVVEGWLPDYALEQALKVFRAGSYRQIYVTGIPLEKGTYLSEYKTYAELGAATLLKLGSPSAQTQAVPGPDTRKDRTYTSALALKAWLDTHSAASEGITVISLGPHARRTRLLFEKGLGKSKPVGIIALEDRDYSPNVWWKSSAGVRNVIDEAIAYTYARLFFWPTKES